MGEDERSFCFYFRPIENKDLKKPNCKVFFFFMIPVKFGLKRSYLFKYQLFAIINAPSTTFLIDLGSFGLVSNRHGSWLYFMPIF